MVSKHKAENNFEFISFVLEWNKWHVDKNYKSCENYDFQQKSTFIWKILMTTSLVLLFVFFMFIFPFCHKIIKNKGHCMVRGILVNTSWKDQGHPADIHVSLIWKWVTCWQIYPGPQQGGWHQSVSIHPCRYAFCPIMSDPHKNWYCVERKLNCLGESTLDWGDVCSNSCFAFGLNEL